MPSRWQREYTCDVCARIDRHLSGRLLTRGVLGFKTAWLICDSCLDLLFIWRGRTYYEIDKDGFDTLGWSAYKP